MDEHLVACSALSATFLCVTLSPPGAQAGEMFTDGKLPGLAGDGKVGSKLAEAALEENVEEVEQLIAAGENMEERDEVSGWRERERKRDRQTDRQTGRQIARQIERERVREREREIEREREKERERERERERETR